MNKDKEPEQLASIALSREEIASRQRIHAGGRNVKPRIEGSGGSSKALWALASFALLLTIALLIQLQQVKKQSDMQLQAITILQDKLTSSGEESNLSVDAIRVLLKNQDHEIRKLWDVANKRNKNGINKNSERLDDQNKLVAKYTGKLELINKDVNKLEKEWLRELTKSKKETTSALAEFKKSLTSLSKKSDKALASVPKNIQKTLKNHTKGIKAMDATRLQLMKRIKTIDTELKKLKKAQAALSAVKPVVKNSTP